MWIIGLTLSNVLHACSDETAGNMWPLLPTGWRFFCFFLFFVLLKAEIPVKFCDMVSLSCIYKCNEVQTLRR